MLKSKMVIFALIIVLLCSLYFLLCETFNGEKESMKKNENEVGYPSTIVNQEKKEQPIAPHSPRKETTTETIRLSPVEIESTDSDAVNTDDYSYSIKRTNKEIKVLPGVSFEPGKGLKVKVPGREETIKIQRDNTYRPSEYKVLLEKKY